MTTVVCRNKECKYYVKGGFCCKETVAIDDNGMCGEWWRKGQVFRSHSDSPRTQILVEEGKELGQNG